MYETLMQNRIDLLHEEADRLAQASMDDRITYLGAVAFKAAEQELQNVEVWAPMGWAVALHGMPSLDMFSTRRTSVASTCRYPWPMFASKLG